MIARIDDETVAPEALWWPAMNFGQFRWAAPIGRYELELPRPELVERLTPAYHRCVRELRQDDRLFPDDESPLRSAGYPPLETLLDHAAARFELFDGHLHEELFAAFLPSPPTAAARFMINSVEEVAARPNAIVLRGRGYHGAPGFAITWRGTRPPGSRPPMRESPPGDPPMPRAHQLPDLPRAFNVADHYLLPNLSPERAARPYMICSTDGSADSPKDTSTDETLTYGDLHRRANRFARALTRLGVEPESRVMLLLRDTLAFPVCFWGTIRRGAVAVPVNTLLSSDDYLYMLEDSRARVLVVDRSLWPKIEPIRGRLSWLEHVVVANGSVAGLPSLDELLDLDAESEGFETVLLTPDDPAFWLYTSGSTGRPKAAVHLHRNMPAASAGLPTTLDLGSDDVHFSAAKLFFAYGLGNALYFPMPHGARSVLLPDWPTPERVLTTLQHHRPTIFYAVPTLYNGLLHALEDWESGRVEPPPGLELPPRLDHLRFCVSAGEALPASLYQRWRERFGCEILDGIGSTENLHDFIANRPGAVQPGSSGQPVPGTEARIVDEHGHDVPDGEVGALWIRSPSTAARYWNRQDRTRATMRGPWMVTGDQYHRDEGGYYWHHGRNDDMMKVSGSWVSPVEVEAALATHPAVAECAVVGREDDEGLTKPCAFVVLRAGFQAEDSQSEDGGGPPEGLADTLRAHAHETIAGFKVPRWVVFVDELPKTATGKIRRFELRAS